MPATTSAAENAVQTPVGIWTGRAHHDDRADRSFTLSFAPDGTVALRTPVSVGTGVWSARQPGRFSYEFTEIFTPAAAQSGRRRIHVEARLEGAVHRGSRAGQAGLHRGGPPAAGGAEGGVRPEPPFPCQPHHPAVQ